MQTSAPACASLIAVARPRPDATPVTSAALPFISIAIDIVCSPAREGTHTHWKGRPLRSEEHTSELQSLLRTSYAVYCLPKINSNFIHSPQFLHQYTHVCSTDRHTS